MAFASCPGLTMTRAWVVPVQVRPGHFELIGALTTWPPPASPEWAQRQPAAGAVILPGQTLNLVVGLTMTTTQVGHSRGPVITYTADGNGYTLQEPTGLRMGGNAPCYIH